MVIHVACSITQGWIATGNTAVVRAFMRGDIAGTKEVCANPEREPGLGVSGMLDTRLAIKPK